MTPGWGTTPGWRVEIEIRQNIHHLLLHRVLEIEGVGDDLIAGLESGDDFLLLVGQHDSGDDRGAAEVAVAERHIDPLAVVQVKNGGGGNGGVSLGMASVECGRGEHADANHSGIFHFDPDLGGVDVGIEDGEDIVDASFERLVGKRVQANLGLVADADGVEIIFVNVADDPDIGKIGDGERVGAG